MTLEQLKTQCADCTRCRLAATRTNVVFGDGNPNAGLMFVGEGPGENEDLQGLPFVGKGGALLNDYLKAVGIDRKKCYIANMVKCRPPHNRDPEEEEVTACIDYLRRQVACIQPKIIVCLGRVAALRMISPEFRVTRQHGLFFERGNLWMMGTFHPAALLRNPAQKEGALMDFQGLREKMKQLGIWEKSCL